MLQRVSEDVRVDVSVYTSGMTLVELFNGKNVFIRTVTYHYTGRVVGGDATSLILEDAAWIADSGRFSAAMGSGNLSEVEPFPAGQVYVSAIVDVHEWTHDLPRKVK